jgi:hypothetical protein
VDWIAVQQPIDLADRNDGLRNLDLDIRGQGPGRLAGRDGGARRGLQLLQRHAKLADSYTGAELRPNPLWASASATPSQE